MASLEILLAGVERNLAIRHQPLHRIRSLHHQRRHKFVLRIDRQRRQGLLLRWQSDLGGPDLHGPLGRVFTTSQFENDTGSKEKQRDRFLSAKSHGSIFGPT